MASLNKKIYNPNPAAWRITHQTPGKAFENWKEPEDPINDVPERWSGDEYNYGRFGPNKYSTFRPAPDNRLNNLGGRTDSLPVIPPKPQDIFVNPAIVKPTPKPPLAVDPPVYTPPSGEKMIFVDPGDVRQILDVFTRVYWRQ